MRDIEAVIIYVVCDEVLKMLGIQDDSPSVMTFCILAAKLQSGNHPLARWSCGKAGYFQKILSQSRLNQRFRQLSIIAWMAVF